MKKFFTKQILAIVSMLVLALGLGLSPAYAVGCSAIANEIGTGINATTSTTTGSGCGTTGSIQSGIGSLAKTAVNILSLVVGVVSVVMIIYGGFKYITSGGESGKVTSAKTTLVYAIIGLVIVALAQLIVQWVLGTSNSITVPAGSLFYTFIG